MGYGREMQLCRKGTNRHFCTWVSGWSEGLNSAIVAVTENGEEAECDGAVV